MAPLLRLFEVLNMAAITLFGRAWVSAQVLRDT